MLLFCFLERIWAACAGKRGKHFRTSGNSEYIQDGRTLVFKLLAFKTLIAFVVLTVFKLPDPGANIYVQSLLKVPMWGAHGRSKSPPHPVVPRPYEQNIDSWINLTLENNYEFYFKFFFFCLFFSTGPKMPRKLMNFRCNCRNKINAYLCNKFFFSKHTKLAQAQWPTSFFVTETPEIFRLS